MKLTPEQQKKLLAYINAKWAPPYHCSCCNHNRWDVADEVFQVIQYTPDGLVLGGPVVPLAPVTCLNCGNTVLINALVAEILEQPTKPEEKGATNGN